MGAKIPCVGYDDCFANNNGYCVCLNSNKFKNKSKQCPFYKTTEQADKERRQIEAQFLREGRADIMKKYYGRNV